MTSQGARTFKPEWFLRNRARFSGTLLPDERLAKHTYYRIGGPATLIAVPRTLKDLEWLTEGIQQTRPRLFILGAGSNLLVSDEGFDGLVIKASRLNAQVQAHGNRIETGAGVAVSSLLRQASQEGWGGLEFLAGIPGSIGGVVAMNGGTHLGEAKDRLTQVTAFDLVAQQPALVTYPREQLRFEYRKNLFLPANAMVWSAEWEIQPEDPAAVKTRIDEVLARRKSTQPLDLPSCGSVFKNPKAHGIHAWQVIEKLGLRGHRIGNAQFSEKHCNFIVNLGGATAADVLALIRLAKERASKELGIELEEEVRLLGQAT